MFNIHDGYNDYLSLSTCKLHVYLLPKSNLLISVPLFWEADMQNLTDHDCFATIICFTNSSDELFRQGSCSFIKVVEMWISPPPHKTSKCSGFQTHQGEPNRRSITALLTGTDSQIYTAVLHWIFHPVHYKSKHMTVSAVMLCSAVPVWISHTINKFGMCGKSMKYVKSQPFPALH